MASGQRGRHRWWALRNLSALAIAVVIAGAPLGVLLAADRVSTVIESLRRSRSFKVRVHAVSVLARFWDRRVIPELARAAASDRSVAVRLVAVEQLAHMPVSADQIPTVRTALRRSLGDRRPEVRAAASRALRRFQQAAAPPAPVVPRPLVVAVGAISDRSGRAGPALRARMRAVLLQNLRRVGAAAVLDGLPPDNSATYVVDGTIARLNHRLAGLEAESDCAVQLIVSRPPRGIVVVVSGEAASSRPRAHYRPTQRESMDAEALEYAVRSAHENLAGFLKTAR